MAAGKIENAAGMMGPREATTGDGAGLDRADLDRAGQGRMDSFIANRRRHQMERVRRLLPMGRSCRPKAQDQAPPERISRRYGSIKGEFRTESKCG